MSSAITEYAKTKDKATEVRITSYMESGELVPDQYVMGALGRSIKSGFFKQSWLLDGLPRTPSQAGLMTTLEPFCENSGCIFYVDICGLTREVLVKRSQGRWEKEQRADDRPGRFITRYDHYQKHIEHLRHFLKTHKYLNWHYRRLKVSESDSPDEVLKKALHVLNVKERTFQPVGK